MIQKELEIINKLGLHARASAKFTQLAAKFKSDVWLTRNARRINAKSIMGVMMLAAGKGVAQPLTARDLEIAEKLGPILAARGLMLVGLDVIGDYLTEVNVTSPTCFQEIAQQTGFDVAAMFIDAVEQGVAQAPA